jgi:hypothetical protein
VIQLVGRNDRLDQLRVCYRGVLTHGEAQAKIGRAYRVLELRPAQCFDGDSDRLVPATEAIFAHA